MKLSWFLVTVKILEYCCLPKTKLKNDVGLAVALSRKLSAFPYWQLKLTSAVNQKNNSKFVQIWASVEDLPVPLYPLERPHFPHSLFSIDYGNGTENRYNNHLSPWCILPWPPLANLPFLLKKLHLKVLNSKNTKK